MKARASYFPPVDAAGSLPDIAGLTARYGRLLLLFKVLIAAGDFTKGLAVSRDIGRAARRLMRGRAQAATRAVKAKMLACPGWRARVIADLGGVRKLALWNAAMDRAIKRACQQTARRRSDTFRRRDDRHGRTGLQRLSKLTFIYYTGA